MKHMGFFLILISWFSLFPAAAQKPEKAKKHCDKANKYYRKYTLRDAQTAVNFYEKALNEDSLYVPALAGLARALALIGYEYEKTQGSAAGYYERAIQIARKAVAADSQSAEARRALAQVYMTVNPSGYGESAYQELLQALALDTTSADVYYLFWMLMYNDQPDHPLIQKSLALDSTNFIAHYSAAVGYAKKKAFPQAIRLYQHCVRINPGHPLPYFGLGNAHSQLKEYVSAIREYQIAIRLNPDFNDSYLYIGLAYYYIGEDKQAKIYLENYMKKSPKSPYRNQVENILKEIKP